MTLEQYMRELWLMDKQYGQEEELYPLINMLLRDGANTEKLSIRDVHNGQSIKEENKNVEQRKYINGFGSFPDLAIFDESFPDLSDENSQEENIASNLQKIYGCVEAKCNKKNPEQIEVKIVAENKSEQPKKENYFIERNNTKIYLHYADTGSATVEGQLLGELLWYGKVLYTNGVIWEYYKLFEGTETINNIRKDYISSINENNLPEGKFEYKTWIFKQCFEQCKKNNLKITITSEEIGNLTDIYQIYQKIKKENKEKEKFEQEWKALKDKKGFEQRWNDFKEKLKNIKWNEDVFTNAETKNPN